MEPFVGRYLSRLTEELDAFTVNWGQGVGYFHPPIEAVPRVIKKVRHDMAKGVLLLPDWPGSVAAEQEEGRGVDLDQEYGVSRI